MAAKVLVIGATNGRFAEAFAKAALLHSKNNFTLALLLGDVFSSPSPSSSTPPPRHHDDAEDIQRLLRGEIPVALPTYFSLGRHSLPAPVRERIAGGAGEVCENLFFLGKKTVLNTSEGLRIVALGGRLDASVATTPNTTPSTTTTTTAAADETASTSTSTAETAKEADQLPFYSPQDGKSLKGANHADLLLTFDWPLGAATGSKVAGGSPSSSGGSSIIAELAAAIRPRYHFACGGPETFWEREPYRNALREGEGQAEVKVTRFLGVADWGNEVKAKALYAFSINTKEATMVVPANATGTPYRGERQRGVKRARPEASGGESFFWGNHTGSGGGDKRQRGGKGGKRQAGPPPGPENCFFCLSYPRLEKHLIVSIGNESYLTTSKGPLTNPTHNPPSLPFSSHILIIPLAHTATLSSIDDAGTRVGTIAEMHQYRRALGKMLADRGCGAVTFEIARARNVHAHWQVVPVPMAKMEGVEEAFREAAKVDEVGVFEKREGGVEGGQEGGVEGQGDYFRVWVGEEADEGGLVMRLGQEQYFDLQFGRKVLAKVLGLKTIHWKDCVLPFEEEVQDANAFKEAFKPFDFSL